MTNNFHPFQVNLFGFHPNTINRHQNYLKGVVFPTIAIATGINVYGEVLVEVEVNNQVYPLTYFRFEVI